MALSCKFYHPVGLAPSSTVSGRCEDDEEGQDILSLVYIKGKQNPGRKREINWCRQDSRLVRRTKVFNDKRDIPCRIDSQ